MSLLDDCVELQFVRFGLPKKSLFGAVDQCYDHGLRGLHGLDAQKAINTGVLFLIGGCHLRIKYIISVRYGA